MAEINIKVIVDTICPFCYIAQKRLTIAIEKYERRHPGYSVAIQWHPFLLHPNLPNEPMKLSAFLASRFGPVKAEQKREMEEEMGHDEGIKFNFNRMISNTFDSHRMIYLAGKTSTAVQSSFVQKIFKGHFEDGEDLASHAFLIQSAVNSGMDRTEAADYLNSNEGTHEVENKVQQARQTGLRDVPHIVIGGLFPISGYYNVDTILGVLERIRSDEIA